MKPHVSNIIRYWRAINAENVKEWRIEFSYKTDFIRGLIEPGLHVLPFLFFGMAVAGGKYSEHLERLIGTGDVLTFTVLGYIFMGFLNTSLWAMGMALRKEQLWGTLEFVFTAPVPRWVYVAGMALHSTMHQGLIILIQILIFYLAIGLGLNLSGILPALIVIGLMLVALYGMGIMVSALTLMFKEGWMVSEALHSAISVVTPIAYPLAVLPVVLREISLTLPTTYGIMTARHFLMGEMMNWTPLESLVRLAFLGLLWVSVGLFVFNAVDKRVRRKGVLAEY